MAWLSGAKALPSSPSPPPKSRKCPAIWSGIILRIHKHCPFWDNHVAAAILFRSTQPCDPRNEIFTTASGYIIHHRPRHYNWQAVDLGRIYLQRITYYVPRDRLVIGAISLFSYDLHKGHLEDAKGACLAISKSREISTISDSEEVVSFSLRNSHNVAIVKLFGLESHIEELEIFTKTHL